MSAFSTIHSETTAESVVIVSCFREVSTLLQPLPSLSRPYALKDARLQERSKYKVLRTRGPLFHNMELSRDKDSLRPVLSPRRVMAENKGAGAQRGGVQGRL